MKSHARVHSDSATTEDEMGFSEKMQTNEDAGEVAGFTDKVDTTEQPVNRDYLEETRVKVKKFMAFSLVGRTYENIFISLSLFSCGEFIYQTYTAYIPDDTIYYFNFVELALAVLFTWDWILCFFIADHKINHLTRCVRGLASGGGGCCCCYYYCYYYYYFCWPHSCAILPACPLLSEPFSPPPPFSFYSMIDLMTVIPIWITRLYPCMDYNNIYSSQDQIVYILCGVTTTRILRALRIRRKLIRIEDEVSRCIGEIALNIVVTMLFFSALFQFLESQDQSYEFHTWMYYIMVTMATVGYGDIAPKSTLGRICAMGLIGFAFLSGPQMSTDLIEKLNRQSIYARAHYVPKYRSTHVYVCGDTETSSIHEFFAELFHEDHEDEEIHAVVMSANAPTSDMMTILRDPVFSLRVTFLEGTALSERDLQRARVREAEAIFIMCNKFALEPDIEDAKTILQQFFLKQYVMRNHSLEKPLFALQLIRPENTRLLVDSSVIEGGNFKEDIILCLNEIKMGIIAKAVMFPGANTLLMNLLTSFADDDDDDMPGEDDHAETEILDVDDQDNWVGEYQKGCGWEIYSTQLSHMFAGTQFATLADILYQRVGIVLFGMLIEDLNKDKSHVRMLLNPADFVIPDQELVSVEAFVIAENKNASDLTFPSADGGQGNEDDSNGALQMARTAAQAGMVYAISHKRNSTSNLPGHGKVPVIKKEHEWQSLLHKYDNNNAGLGSEQEISRQLEVEYIKANFFTLLPLQANIDDCTIYTSLESEAPYVNEHTLIVGKNLSNLFDLVRPLRAAYLGYIRPIVILTPNPISQAIWARISIFQGVFVVIGSMLEELDVIRAGIFKASQCIVLADQTEKINGINITAGAKATLAALTDTAAIFSYQQVMKMNPKISICIEIVNAANVGFLDPKEGMVSGEVDYKFTPQFASGALLVSSLLDTLICQVGEGEAVAAYFNHYIFKVTNLKKTFALANPILFLYISHRQAFYNRSIVSVMRLFTSGVEVRDRDTIRAKILGQDTPERKGVAALVGSSLYAMKVPDTNVRTYGELFTSLAKNGIIAVGLYRGVFKNIAVGPKQNKMPYVFTNPPKETEVFSCDKVFVLSQKPILGQRTLSKRTDWSLTRVGSNIDPVEKLRRNMTSADDRTVRKMERLDAKVDGLMAALKEVSGVGKFAFELQKETDDASKYRMVHESPQLM